MADYITKGSFNLGNQITLKNKNSNIDRDYGPYEGKTLEEIATQLEATIQAGKTIGVIENGQVVEYWWLNGEFIKKGGVTETSQIPELKTEAKTIVGAINEVRSQAMSSHLIIHGGEVVQNYVQYEYFFSTEIVHNLPAGKYIVSATMESSLLEVAIEPFGYSSIIVREEDNVKGIYDLSHNNGRVEIELSSPASLYISALMADYLEYYYSQYTDVNIPDFGEAIPVDAVFTFKNIWVLPAHECDLGTVESRLNALEELPVKTADVSLFAKTEKGRLYDDVYVKAPAGTLKETDQVIFARYITNKNRPLSPDRTTDKSVPRKVYRGWIKPTIGGVEGGMSFTHLLLSDDMLKLIYQNTIDGYDHFYLQVDPNGYDLPLLNYLWEFARVDEDGYRHPRVKDKKLGIKIVRDGKTIVDYLPFTVRVDSKSHIHFGRL